MPTSATEPISDCAEFTIPNTIYIELGPPESWIDRVASVSVRMDGFAPVFWVGLGVRAALSEPEGLHGSTPGDP